MVLTYYHNSEKGPHISLTFPPQMAVISIVTDPIHGSPIFTHLLFFSLSRSLSSCFTFALFWVSALGYSMLSVPSASFRLVSFLLFPTFCLFALFLQFIIFFPPIYSYNYVSLKSNLSLYKSLSSRTVFLFLFLPLYIPPQLTLSHLLNLSTCLYLGLLSAVTHASDLGSFYLSLSVSPRSVFTCSLFVFPSAALLCLATSRQGCWQRWARAYLKCHWQSDKRSYGK